MEVVWDWKSIGSLLATLMFLRTAVRDFLPAELRHFIRAQFSRVFSALRPTNTIIIDEYDAASTTTNHLFDAARSYLSSRCLATAPVLRLSKSRNSRVLISSLPASHTVADSFRGIPLRWCFHTVERPQPSGARAPQGRGFFELSFHSRHRAAVDSQYIPHLLDEADRLRLKARKRRLYTNRPFSSATDDRHLWSSVPFAHPSTFDTLAIEPALSDDIRGDLLRFSTRRDYYARAGRAWKRGYLLHGPPGTGKTSLVAAIANFLEFDVYDLELTAVTSNSHLRKLLVSTSSKSVIVVEDVDCSLDLSERTRKKKNPTPTATISAKPDPDTETEEAAPPRAPSTVGYWESEVSLSGVLNFVDGLWSSCVGERLMVFTTNHPERLDPALLRPGRMDRQIHLSYCGPAAFRTLAKNYLQVEVGHELMAEAQALLAEVRMTPAEVAEMFLECDGDDADVGMQKVVQEMRRRKALQALQPLPPEGSGEVEKGGEGRVTYQCCESAIQS